MCGKSGLTSSALTVSAEKVKKTYGEILLKEINSFLSSHKLKPEDFDKYVKRVKAVSFPTRSGNPGAAAGPRGGGGPGGSTPVKRAEIKHLGGSVGRASASKPSRTLPSSFAQYADDSEFSDFEDDDDFDLALTDALARDGGQAGSSHAGGVDVWCSTERNSFGKARDIGCL